MTDNYLNGAVYLRVSTDEQLEYSIDAQLKEIKKYAKQNNIIITKEHIYVDEGISGRRAVKRPAFMKMIAISKTKPKPFDVILVHKFDRFARSREDSVVYKSLLKRECDIRVVSITESIEDDKFSVILEAMLEAMAEYYSLNLAEEVKKGMTEKATRGEYQTIAPFGYAWKDKEIIINTEEEKYIKYIFESFAINDMTYRKIASNLNDFGIKTHRGNDFESRTIEYIIRNPIYIGKVRWCPTGKRNRYDYNNPDVIIADGHHDAIITMDLWEKAQEKANHLKEVYRYRERTTTKKKTWLSGLVRCGNCNKVLVVSGKDYLQCNGYIKGQCKVSQHIKIVNMEQKVSDVLKEVYHKKLDIKVIPKISNVDDTNTYELLNRNLKKLEEREKRVKIAYQDGIDSLEEYKDNKSIIDEERKNLLHKLKNLTEELKQGGNTNNDIFERIASVYELIIDDTVDIEIKSQTVKYLIQEIQYSKQDQTIKILYK